VPAILGLDHVQLAMPAGREAEARAFFVGLLGFREVPKPAHLAVRGGLWLQSGGAQLHLGVTDPFIPARKAHPAFLIDDLAGFHQRLAAAGHAVTTDAPLPEHDRLYVDDPFGNRIELMQRRAAGSAAREA
jgi:catechol 2,3-dioxygenase-like lactoylglutathione lyase family enzyme